MSNQLIENFIPPIQSDGLNTNTNTALGGTLAVTGATTLASTLAVTGASTFTGTSTFTASPVFNGGRKASVLASSGNTSPTAAQSGSTLLFDSGTGITFTLPAPVVGLEYTFVVANTVTSGTHGILTNGTSTFVYGALAMGTAGGTSSIVALGNGTAHLGVSMNGTTTGGILGSRITVVCTSATKWEFSGVVAGSGTLATPFV